MKALLLSNSTAPGRAYLDHALTAIGALLGERRSILFVPFALADHDAYTAQVRSTLRPLGVEVTGAHAGDAAGMIAEAEAIFVGGGNTFRLVKELHDRGLMPAIRGRVAAGTPYLGSSAGTNIAAPTLRTTNDMPIVQPPSFETLGLVPFQINPHYLDPDPTSTHQGETREARIVQFLEENDVPVLGLREGTWLSVAQDACTLGGGSQGARLFVRGRDAVELGAGADLSWLLHAAARFDLGPDGSGR